MVNRCQLAVWTPCSSASASSQGHFMSYQSTPPYVTSLLREVEDLRREVSVLSEKLDLVLGLLRSDKDSIGSFELFEGEPQGPREVSQPASRCAAERFF